MCEACVFIHCEYFPPNAISVVHPQVVEIAKRNPKPVNIHFAAFFKVNISFNSFKDKKKRKENAPKYGSVSFSNTIHVK